MHRRLYFVAVAALLFVPALGMLLRYSKVAAAASESLSPASPETASFYVATNGNDKWSGKLPAANSAGSDGPFATLDRAREAVRKLKSSGPVTVLLRGGLYTLDKPVIFGTQDSGSNGSPIIYAAYPGETPVISGGRAISGWKQGSNGLWTAQVPGVKEGQWYAHQLFVNGQRRTRARTPNSGYFTVDQMSADEGTRFDSSDVKSEMNQDGDAEIVALDKWIDLRARIHSIDGRSVTLYGRRHPLFFTQTRYWVENSLAALDAPGEWYLSRREGTLYYKPMTGEDASHIQAVATDLDLLMKFDGSPSNNVHDIQFRGITFTYADWAMPSANFFNHIQADADVPGAIEATGAHALTFDHCIFSHMGGYALGFNKGSKQNQFLANQFFDVGAGAIKIGEARSDVHPSHPPNSGGPIGPAGGPGGGGGGFGQRRGPFGQRRGGQQQQPPQDMSQPANFSQDASDYRVSPNFPRSDAETPSGNVISDNLIYDIGSVFPGTAAIWVGQSYGNTISHNDIHNIPYCGISVGWTWGYGPAAARDNLIEYNHIYDAGQGIMSDLGAIYLLGDQPGTVLRYNLLHDISRYDGKGGYGGWGIYLDATTSHIQIENNIVYNTEDGALHHNSGQLNTVTNNIFAFGKVVQIIRNSPSYEISFTFEHNIVYWTQGAFLRSSLQDGKFKFDYNDYYTTQGKNFMVGVPRLAGVSFSEWQASGQDTHSIVADPRFVDAEHGNYSLRSDSPAFQLGFKQIDMSTVGPRKNAK